MIYLAIEECSRLFLYQAATNALTKSFEQLNLMQGEKKKLSKIVKFRDHTTLEKKKISKEQLNHKRSECQSLYISRQIVSMFKCMSRFDKELSCT